MEPPSPVRLFATLAGAALFVYGIAGFFFDSSFARPDDLRGALGLASVNGWANSFHLLTGALGLLVAGFASRRYAIWLAALYAAVAALGSLVWGATAAPGR
jgi:Domain of unknown function (DUF4383)